MTDKISRSRRPVIIAVVLLIEIAVLCSMFIIAGNLKRSDETRDLDLALFESDYAVQDGSDHSWTIEENNVGGTEGDHVYALRGPFLDIGSGDYRVNVSYRADSLQYVKAYSKENNASVLAAFERLEPYSDHVSFDVRLKKDIHDLEFVFLYMKTGTFTVDGISLTTNKAAPIGRALAVTLMVFILFDICAAFFIARYPKRPDVIAVTGIVLAVILPSLPLLVPGLAQGHDLPFHATRTEGIWQELCAGQFPVRMESLWLGGYGYASEIYYGDLFLYFPALLRLSGFTITEAFKFYILFINIATAFVSYFSFRKITGSRYAPAVSSVLYSCAAFRMTDLYVRTTAGEMAALIFLPVVAAGFIGILRNDPAKKIPELFFDGLLLAAGMSGLILTHIITTEMVLVLLIILSLIEIRKMIRRIPTVLAAIVTTFLITCSFAIPFLDYTMKVSTRISVWMMADASRNIQGAGAPPSSYLKFARPFFGSGASGADNMMSLTPGLLLISFTIAALVLIVLRKAPKRMVISLVSSLILLFCASNVFPWDFLENNLFFGKALVSIQFPWRLLGLVILFMSVTAGDVISHIENNTCKENNKNNLILFVIILVIQSAMAGVTLYAYATEGNFEVQYLDRPSLDTSYLGDNEYVPSGVDLEKLSHAPSASEGIEYEVRSSSDDYALTVTSPAPAEGFIDIPVIFYPYYRASGNNGMTLDLSSGDNGLIRVMVPEGYEGDITVNFTHPMLWRIADLVSCLSVAGAAAFAVLYKKKHDPVN